MNVKIYHALLKKMFQPKLKILFLGGIRRVVFCNTYIAQSGEYFSF